MVQPGRRDDDPAAPALADRVLIWMGRPEKMPFVRPFLPAGPEDGPLGSPRRRAALGVLFVFSGLCLVTPMTLFNLLAGEPSVGAVLAGQLVALASTLVLYRLGRPLLAGWSVLLACTVAIELSSALKGGLASSVTHWYPPMVLLAVMLLVTSQALVWTLVWIGLRFVVAVTTPAEDWDEALGPAWLYASSISATYLGVFAFGAVFQQAWRTAFTQARDAARTRSRFLATMSHEIRTPLNGVLGLTDALLDRPLPDDIADTLQTVRRSGASLLAILDDVLDLSKIDADRLVLDDGVVEVRQVVDEVVQLFAQSALQRDTRLTGIVDDAVSSGIRGDPQRVRQILANLVGNAVKFTQGGTVAVRVDQAGGRVRFEVRDTGPGMPEQDVARVFDAFEQADDSTTRRHGGTGLGLTICARLVEQMHGNIGVDSVLGEGSRFWFELPVVEAAPVSVAIETEPAVGALRGRVLVAEDNLVNQRVIEAALRQLGLEVDVVADGVQLLAALEAGVPDLVLLDCYMPEMAGFDSASAWRAREASDRRLPIVALTASVLEEDRRRCREAGMDAVLAKPIDRAALRQTLGRWLAVDATREGAG